MKLSVLTPSYDYAHYLEDALTSVDRQHGASVEHVVIDDGSHDDSVEILRRWPGQLVWREKPNAGLSATLNDCLEDASGDVVGWLNADDYYLPGALERALAIFRAEPRTDVVFGDSVFVDAAGRVTRLLGQHPFHRRLLTRLPSPPLSPVALFIRRSALPARPFDEGMRVLMDWDLYFQLVDRGARFHYEPRCFGAFRRHEAQASGEPMGDDHPEWVRLTSRHGMRRGNAGRLDRLAGNAAHAALKLVAGSYRRQLTTNGLRGRDTRWFATQEGADTAASLLGMYR